MNTIGKTGVLPLLIIRIIMARGMSFLEKSREGVAQKKSFQHAKERKPV